MSTTVPPEGSPPAKSAKFATVVAASDERAAESVAVVHVPLTASALF